MAVVFLLRVLWGRSFSTNGVSEGERTTVRGGPQGVLHTNFVRVLRGYVLQRKAMATKWFTDGIPIGAAFAVELANVYLSSFDDNLERERERERVDPRIL